MNENGYNFTENIDEYQYDFLSISDKKTVQKVVILTVTENPKIFNLALFDRLENGLLSDISESKNNDLEIILATVFKIIEKFLTKNFDKFVLFRGSDDRRQRLYRIAISRELEQLLERFNVWGVVAGTPVPFSKNQEFEFYLIGNK
jgi:hypothetical protein